MAWLAFAVAVAVNLVVVLWPAAPPGAATVFPQADKVTHLLVFAAVAYTGRWVRLPYVPLLLLLAVHAATSELTQYLLLPGRTGDLADTVADLLGVAAGGVLPLAGGAVRLGP